MQKETKNFIKKNISILEHNFSILGQDDCDYFMSLPEAFNDHLPLFVILKNSGFRPETIIDVGASYGLFALGASIAFANVKLYCYEPHPSSYISLLENTQPLNERVRSFNLALGCSEGFSLYHPGGPINPKRSSGAHLMNVSHWKSQNTGIYVPISTLDAQVKTQSISRIDLIKIDVEGFELDVIEGGVKTIKEFSPLIYLEFNSWTLIALKNVNPRDFLDYLSRHFSFIYRCNKDASVTRILTPEDRIHFLYDNLISHGCIDDLLVSNTDYLNF